MTTATLKREDVTVTPCTCGRLVRLATRWQRACWSCGEPIPVGAVGPFTADDCHTDGSGRHDWGTYSHQHSCGAWNSPLEVTAVVGFYDGGLAEAIDAGLADLADLVEWDQQQTVARLRVELRELADRAVRHLAENPGHPTEGPDQSCEDVDCPLRGGELTPGAFVDETEYDGRRLIAWDWDPTSDEGDTVDVVVALTDERR